MQIQGFFSCRSDHINIIKLHFCSLYCQIDLLGSRNIAVSKYTEKYSIFFEWDSDPLYCRVWVSSRTVNGLMILLWKALCFSYFTQLSTTKAFGEHKTTLTFSNCLKGVMKNPRFLDLFALFPLVGFLSKEEIFSALSLASWKNIRVEDDVIKMLQLELQNIPVGAKSLRSESCSLRRMVMFYS